MCGIGSTCFRFSHASHHAPLAHSVHHGQAIRSSSGGHPSSAGRHGAVGQCAGQIAVVYVAFLAIGWIAAEWRNPLAWLVVLSGAWAACRAVGLLRGRIANVLISLTTLMWLLWLRRVGQEPRPLWLTYGPFSASAQCGLLGVIFLKDLTEFFQFRIIPLKTWADCRLKWGQPHRGSLML